MKKFLILILTLFSCQKTINTEEMKTVKEYLHEKHGKHFQDCNFGISSFNLEKRILPEHEKQNANKTSKGIHGEAKGGHGGRSGGTLLLDFDGFTVTGTSWNFAGDIVCAPANLTSAQVDEIFQHVTEKYAPYNVVVTTDESVFQATPQNKRMRLILTETWEWYGQAGGVSFIGSFGWSPDTPCFVFTSLLGYNTKYIMDAGTHELGHTLGLYHQSTYDANCVKTSEYNYGGCPSMCGEAPIMGVAYYQDLDVWWIGPNPYGCNNIQDDNQILTQKLGLR